MTTSSNEVVIPKVLIVPTSDPSTLSTAQIGTIVMHGGKLQVATSEGSFEEVTSA